jgi:hypothetical protein
MTIPGEIKESTGRLQELGEAREMDGSLLIYQRVPRVPQAAEDLND